MSQYLCVMPWLFISILLTAFGVTALIAYYTNSLTPDTRETGGVMGCVWLLVGLSMLVALGVVEHWVTR